MKLESEIENLTYAMFNEIKKLPQYNNGDIVYTEKKITDNIYNKIYKILDASFDDIVSEIRDINGTELI